MFLKNFAIATAIVLYCNGALGCDLEQSIQNYLKENQPIGTAPGIIINQYTGVHRGTLLTTAVLFTYPMDENRDRYDEKLIIFENCNPSDEVAVGRRGVQSFDAVKVERYKIVLHGLKWEPDDAMCCPSEKVSLSFTYNGTGMPIAIAGET